MDESALSLREHRQTITSAGLRTEARRLTAERGFSGFTIEELCSEVGVSRRTFFNYYASKENAVLGIAVKADASDLDESFITGTGALLDDLADLAVARWDRQGTSRSDVEELGAAFEREPRLFSHFIGLVAESERADIALAARRVDAPTALQAETAVQLIGSLIRPSVFAFFADDSTPFGDILRERLATARALFCP